jgi:tripartite-type tricarboxylate transporter receptor subunit TctC
MRADPDGYTILMGQMGTHAASVSLYPNLAYRPDADFEPIGMVTAFPIIIAARKDFPAKDLKEFVAHLKANAGTLNQAHAGVGSIFFTTCLLLNSIVGAKPTLVPFNGGAPAMSALVGGQVDYMCADIATGGSHVEPGRIKVYAIASTVRNPGIADVPTTVEAGLPEFQASAWNGLFAPKATPSRFSTCWSTRSTRRSTTTRPASACWFSAAIFPTSRSAARRPSWRWSRARSRAGHRSLRRPTSRWSRLAGRAKRSLVAGQRVAVACLGLGVR